MFAYQICIPGPIQQCCSEANWSQQEKQPWWTAVNQLDSIEQIAWEIVLGNLKIIQWVLSNTAMINASKETTQEKQPFTTTYKAHQSSNKFLWVNAIPHREHHLMLGHNLKESNSYIWILYRMAVCQQQQSGYRTIHDHNHRVVHIINGQNRTNTSANNAMAIDKPSSLQIRTIMSSLIIDRGKINKKMRNSYGRCYFGQFWVRFWTFDHLTGAKLVRGKFKFWILIYGSRNVV